MTDDKAAKPPAAAPSAPPVPAVSADGALLANVGKYARGVTLAAFAGIGGVRRLTEVADDDPKWFFEKMFSKLVQPEKVVVAESSDDVEDLLRKLDRRVIDVDAPPAGGGDDDDDDQG